MDVPKHARDYDGFNEEKRVKKLTLDAEAFPNAGELQQDEIIGRLKVTDVLGDRDEVSGSTSIYEINADNLLPAGDMDGDGDVDRDDIGIIRSHRGEPASVCFECDIDGDGVITIRDARKLVKMCTRPRCACE